MRIASSQALYKAHQVIAKRSISLNFLRGFASANERIQEHDCAVIRHKGQTIALTAPLRVGGRTSTRLGDIDHDTIIGKQPRDVIISSNNRELRVHIPTLEEYVLMTPRSVTPIYPADANLIVSLLDLHPDGSQSTLSSDLPNRMLNILEAGTGNGALTLYLARAIHAANSGWESSISDREPKHRAIIHTVDESPSHSKHAVKIVSAFRRGMYMRDIMFHVGDVSVWIDQQLADRDRSSFLSHVILDLPSSYSHVEKAASVLHVDGKLILFNPSVTQINAAVELVNARKLPLQLERVVEVGPAMTGGRTWDLRLVRPRALAGAVSDGGTLAAEVDDSQPAGNELDGRSSQDRNEGFRMVCKPKVGDRISGGGFVALWSKNKTRTDC